jgi:hypothetical protein
VSTTVVSAGAAAVSTLVVSTTVESVLTESVVAVLEPLQATKEAITKAKAAILNEFFMFKIFKVTI